MKKPKAGSGLTGKITVKMVEFGVGCRLSATGCVALSDTEARSTSCWGVVGKRTLKLCSKHVVSGLQTYLGLCLPTV